MQPHIFNSFLIFCQNTYIKPNKNMFSIKTVSKNVSRVQAHIKSTVYSIKLLKQHEFKQKRCLKHDVK